MNETWRTTERGRRREKQRGEFTMTADDCGRRVTEAWGRLTIINYNIIKLTWFQPGAGLLPSAWLRSPAMLCMRL